MMGQMIPLHPEMIAEFPDDRSIQVLLYTTDLNLTSVAAKKKAKSKKKPAKK